MALSQVQVIRSLAEALAWFEKELGWGVAPAELNHLTGRIGELYAAMITRGQMALDTNQYGYDVISADNERISVKTVTSSSRVAFNANTFHLVDRVMVLRVNIDEEEGVSVETLLDCPAADFAERGGTLTFGTGTGTRPRRPVEDLRIVAEATLPPHRVMQYENGTILVAVDGVVQPVAKPLLRLVAAEIGVDLLSGTGRVKTTRQLGADIVRSLNVRGTG